MARSERGILRGGRQRALAEWGRKERASRRWWARIVPKAKKFGVKEGDLAVLVFRNVLPALAYERAAIIAVYDTIENQLDLFVAEPNGQGASR